MHPTRTLLILLAVLLLIAAIAFIASPYASPITQLLAPPAPVVTPLRQITVQPPPRTKTNTTTALGKQTTFAMLISYVDSGFEPKTFTLKAGDTVRFINNSSTDLNLCGTAFTSCKELKPGEYWEFTFAKAGMWTYNDKISGATGAVTVQ